MVVLLNGVPSDWEVRKWDDPIAELGEMFASCALSQLHDAEENKRCARVSLFHALALAHF